MVGINRRDSSVNLFNYYKVPHSVRRQNIAQASLTYCNTAINALAIKAIGFYCELDSLTRKLDCSEENAAFGMGSGEVSHLVRFVVRHLQQGGLSQGQREALKASLLWIDGSLVLHIATADFRVLSENEVLSEKHYKYASQAQFEELPFGKRVDLVQKGMLGINLMIELQRDPRYRGCFNEATEQAFERVEKSRCGVHTFPGFKTSDVRRDYSLKDPSQFRFKFFKFDRHGKYQQKKGWDPKKKVAVFVYAGKFLQEREKSHSRSKFYRKNPKVFPLLVDPAYVYRLSLMSKKYNMIMINAEEPIVALGRLNILGRQICAQHLEFRMHGDPVSMFFGPQTALDESPKIHALDVKQMRFLRRIFTNILDPKRSTVALLSCNSATKEAEHGIASTRIHLSLTHKIASIAPKTATVFGAVITQKGTNGVITCAFPYNMSVIGREGFYLNRECVEILTGGIQLD